jgi:hypothetical protein
MCRLVITEILSQSTPNGRVQCIEKWGMKFSISINLIKYF